MRPNPQETADLVTFTEEILNGKLIFCAVIRIPNSRLYFIYWNIIDQCFYYLPT